jgi:hypothetical protein
VLSVKKLKISDMDGSNSYEDQATHFKPLILKRFNKDACFSSRFTISIFLMLLHNNGIILMVLWVVGIFIVPPCPIIIIYHAKGKAGEEM